VYHPENNKYYMYLFVDGMWHVNPSSDGTPETRRHPMFVASSDSPAGPFTDPKFVTLAFDPAVLVDTEKNAAGKSRVYLYWTPEESRSAYAVELDPTDMATILPGTKHFPLGATAEAPFNTMPDWDAPFYMFEGSSVRKVGDWYLMAYCRGVRDTFNATSNISEIGWAYASAPFGPWTYGGVVVSNKGEFIANPYTGDPNTPTYTAGNIHGGMVDLNGQWYQVYHRDTFIAGKRQAMVEPFNLVLTAAGPRIEQVELTSQGFETGGLNPYAEQYAGYAAYIFPAVNQGPPGVQTGPRFFSQNNDATINFDPDATRDDWYPVQNLTNQSWLGYKYFNFPNVIPASEYVKLKLVLTLEESLPGSVKVYSANAKTKFSDPEQPKTLIGTIDLAGGTPAAEAPGAAAHQVQGYVDTATLVGKKGIYLEFLSEESGEIAQLNKLQFVVEDNTPPPPPQPTAAVASPSVAQDGKQTVSGAGFQPGEQVAVWLDQTLLTTVAADAAGKVSHTFTVPKALAVGAHTVALRGATSGSVEVTFQVTRSGLPVTGGTTGQLTLAAFLMCGLGAATYTATRRRRTEAA
jgi:hypothetical protein